MELFVIIRDILMATGAYIIDNAGAIATLAGVAMALYGLNHWKREYRFKRNSELLEEALVLFYQAEHAIDYLRNGVIFSDDLNDFKFPSELEDGYSKEKYKYTYTIQKRFDEKQHIFNKLYAIELRVRARFGDELIDAFSLIRTKVKELLLAARQYSIKGLQIKERSDIQKIIWKGYKETGGEVSFENKIRKIVEDFDKLCRDKMQ